jgi:hypothetical protein
MEVICALAFVLLVVVVVGHGIWVAVAWMLRQLAGSGSDREPAGKPCPHCGARYGVVRGRCIACGAVPNVSPAATTLRDELRTANRQLSRLLDRGAISQQQFNDLRAVIQTELECIGEVRPQLAPLAGTKLVPEQRETTPRSEAPAPGLVPAASASEVIEAVLVESPMQLAAPAAVAPVHPLDRPLPPAEPKAPVTPARPLADVLQSFMEESNIRWGEILAAILIVVCSVGLVISIQATYQIPYFPALVFTLFAAAFHGAGLYTLRRWKIEVVSRVILIISLLLVPLVFCGAIVTSGSGDSQRPLTDPLFLVVLLSGVGVFTWVSYTASRELIGPGSWPLAAGIVVGSASQVLIHRLALAGIDFWRLNVIAAVPLGSFIVGTGWQLARAWRWRQLSQRRVTQILLVLGTAAFAMLAPIVLLLVRSGAPWANLARLSPGLSIPAAIMLALGLVMHMRTTAVRLSAWRTTGTAISVLGGALLMALVAIAWPEPELLLAIGLINCLILAGMGAVSGLPVLYVPAVACAALAVTIGLHLMGGHFADRERLSLKLVQAALMGRTGLGLTALAGVIAGLGIWSGRRRVPHGAILLASSAGLAVAAAFIAAFSGFVVIPNWPQDRDLSAPLLLFYSVVFMAAGPLMRWPHVMGIAKKFLADDATQHDSASRDEYFWPTIVGIGSLLSWAALVQALLINGPIRGWLAGIQWLPSQPILVATVAEGIIMALLAAAAMGRAITASTGEFHFMQTSPRGRWLVEPLAACAMFWLILAAPFIIAATGDQFTTHALMAICCAAAWALVAASTRWQFAVSGLQVMAAVAPAILIARDWKAKLGGADWIIADEHLMAQIIAVALGAIVWSITRRLTGTREVLRELLNAPWPSVDQMLLGVAAVGVAMIALLGAAPHVAWELGFGDAVIEQANGIGAGVLSTLNLSWIALAAVLAALMASLWERVWLPAAVGVGLATFAAVWLAAGHFESSVASASAARWAAAIYALAWASLYIARGPLLAAARRLSWLKWDAIPAAAGQWFCAQPLVLGGATILILTILAVQQSVSGEALRGPIAGSAFAQMGLTASYAGPLMALVGLLLGYAIRERRAAYALGGAAVSQLAVNLAYMLHVSTSPAQPTNIRVIEWLQWNAVGAGAYALVWLGLARWITPAATDENERKLADAFWAVPVAVSSAASAILVAWGAWIIAAYPQALAVEIETIGTWLSYTAVGLALAAVIGKSIGWSKIYGLGDAATWLAAGLVVLVAASLNRFDTGGQWIAYHALEAGWLLVGAAACAAVCWREGRSGVFPNHLSAALLGSLVTALAVRGNFADPNQPWWSLAGALGGCAIATALGLALRSQPYAFASTALAALSFVLLWFAPKSSLWIDVLFGGPYTLAVSFVECLLFVVAAAGGFWLWRENRSQSQRNESFDIRPWMPRVHSAVLIGSIPIHSFVRLFLAFAEEGPLTLGGYYISIILTTVILLGLLALSLWDRRAFFATPLAYLWAAGVWCLGVALAGQWLVGNAPRTVALLLAMAGHVTFTGQLWSYGANLAAVGQRLGVSDPVGGLVRTGKWLPLVNLLLVALIAAGAFVGVLTLGELPLRVAAAWGPAIAAWGVACLAQERRRDALQLAALLVAGFSAVLLAWAQIGPSHEPAVWLTRVFRLLMVLAALTFVYGLALPRFLLTAGSWNAATRKAGYITGSAALVTFAATLALEMSLFEPGKGAPVADVQVVAIAVVLVGLIAGLISMALLPGRDPLVLSEKGRQGYVYAALATGALLFAHLYVCKPLWFDGFLRPYWPFVVMALAFVGVGGAELFHRFRIKVLAEPLERTGSLLPLLPVLGWWVAGPQVDYSLLLFVVGIMYLGLSYARRSWAAMVAAAVAGNGALWALLYDTGYHVAAHPQFWLIPPALSALAAAQINRHRLAPEMLAAVRYGATIVIYLSSTSEMFIRGFGDSLAPPMILLALSVAGFFVGIALRVRAFLFLGMTFTLLALTSMVAHAAQSVNDVWPWWVFGIFLSVAMLVLFGLIEKKREEVTALIARLRKWEA